MLVFDRSSFCLDPPCEVPIFVADGIPADCVINTDNLHTIPKERLRQRITRVPEDRTFALDDANHECEIAQSEALSGKPLAKYWFHTGPVR